jgi:hypothetical protein
VFYRRPRHGLNRKLAQSALVLGLLAVAAAASLVAVAPRAQASSASTGAERRWCRGGDPPIRVSKRTSCAFAGRVVTHVYDSRSLSRGGTRIIYVRSPVTHKRYRLRVVRRGSYVIATGANGIWMRFFYQA